MIFVTGATGHTGTHVIERIQRLYPGHPIRCFVRASSDTTQLRKANVELVIGDLQDEKAVAAAVTGAICVVHVANIRYSPAVVKAAVSAGVHQVILVHTTGMYSKYRAYAHEYQAIEDRVLQIVSGTLCRYTILRPTMIYGDMRDHNFHKLIRVLSRTRVFPVFGSGAGKIQPVHVEDLADSIVSSISNERAYNMSFNISGGSVHSYKEVLALVATLLRRRVFFFHIPVSLAVAASAFLGLLKLSPVSVEQVRRLSEDKAFDHSAAAECLAFSPRRLEIGLQQEIDALGHTRKSS